MDTLEKLKQVEAALEPFADLKIEIDRWRHPDQSSCQHRLKAEDIRKAYDALALLPSIMEAVTWQPIATAPRDGTPIDLWIKYSPGRAAFDGRKSDCHWDGEKWVQFDPVFDEWYGVEQLSTLRDGGFWFATHWKPLPEPPSEGTKP